MKKAVLGALFVGAILASCSNDEPGNNQPVDGEYSYLAVNIVTPKESASPGSQMKAAADGGFANGSADEDAAETAAFVLFDKDNKVTQVITNVNLMPWKGLGGTYSPNVENVSSAVLLVGPQANNDSPTSVLAILNAPSDINSTTWPTGTDLATVESKVANYSTTGAKGSFIMTNSVYLDASGAKQITASTEGKFAKTEDAAKNNPVNIYVERVVAKINTHLANSETQLDITNPTVTVDGTETTAHINVKGIQIANIATQSYLFKNITGFTTTSPWNGWSDANNKRSYWAVTPTAQTYDNHSWNAVSGQETGSTALDVDAPHSFYVQENVFTAATTPAQNTAVLVTAQLTDASGNPLKLVKIADVYYTPANGLMQVVNSFVNNRHYYYKDGDAYKTIPLDYFEWATKAPSYAEAADAKDWEGFVQLKEDYKNTTFYQYNSSVEGNYEEKTYAQVNAALCEKALRPKVWTDGMCYYFVDIEHFGLDANNKNLKGIIRNHIYDLTLNSLTGLGVPVFDPDKIIIPEVPGDDEYFYLAAQINVLKWKVVSQTVDFNN